MVRKEGLSGPLPELMHRHLIMYNISCTIDNI